LEIDKAEDEGGITMAIKCGCGSFSCTGKVWFEGTQLWFTNDLLRDGGRVPSELSIYLDANGLVELIKEAKKELMGLTEGKDV
jgi:hypothetical protein